MGLALLTGPAETVVSIDEALLHLRADSHEDDTEILGLVRAATAQAEAFCRRRFVTQQWRLTLDAFPAGAIILLYPPLASVQSVKYVDQAGDLQTLDAGAYVVRSDETPGRIVRAYDTSWPTVRAEEGAVRVEFTCGYGGAAAVPDAAKRAVLLIVGTLYANRETVAPVAMQAVPQSAEWLLGPLTVRRW